MNLLLGTISALVMAIIISLAADFSANSPVMVAAKMLRFSVIINFILAFFNLIPLYPLDGSKMVPRFLNHEWQRKYEDFCQYGQFILTGLILLSFVGLPVFNILLYPAMFLANYLPQLFLTIIS